ncbi:hypothetical protein [Nocardioides sp. B-3]|uniref:hypothetical protein n=1 Tax=Nocardioides sp. B-3 TaxID=2895565 RepID=UPI002152CFEE|nr:hypothetical protein [Nocardioides sp. B-3]UUZ59679.1 hypothetical protein LP418_00565 [Nocardioides sp. B-3]
MTSRARPFGPEVMRQLTLDTEPWLSCDDCFHHVDEYVERLLAAQEQAMPAMAVHLRGCPACAEEAETLVIPAAEDSGMDPRPVLAGLGAG